MDDPACSLLERDGARLHALLYRITLREDVAADLLQDLFLRLSGSSPFRAARQPSAYARRAAMNLALAWRRQRRATESLDGIAVAAASRDPLDTLGQAEDVERVLDAVSRLPSELSRLCFLMRFLEQDSYDAIAAAIGRTPHQARGLCHAAVRQVREAVGVSRIEGQVADD